jgi:chloride channel 3/4/5
MMAFLQSSFLSQSSLITADERSISFKRKSPTNASPFSISGLLSQASRLTSTFSPSRNSGRQNPSSSPRRNGSPSNDGSAFRDSKDANPLDWYVEGPGRRVGYDNLTAIDWIFEYAKERQRQRILQSSNNGLSGYLVQLGDASQIWAILIATGLAAGLFAAFIDIASDWLGDLKAGVCSNVESGGQFYLSKPFCCWGHNGEWIE